MKAERTRPLPGRLEPIMPVDRRRTVICGAAAAALLVLSVLVATGRTVGLDDWARQLFRPDDHWGDLQVRVDVVVEGLRPRNAAVVLLLVTLAVAFRRRSWLPLLSVAAVAGAGIGLTLALKVLVARADTHGDLGALGGSYPSGHVLATLVASGCLVLLLQEQPGPLSWSLAGLVTAVMAWALLVQTAHWLTDVLGGVLVGMLVLAPAPGLPFRGGGGPSPDQL